MSYFWIILGILALVLLGVYWNKRNAVWGGLTIGVIAGLLVVSFSFFRGDIFDWYLIVKGATIGTLVGWGAELLGVVSYFIKKKKI